MEIVTDTAVEDAGEVTASVSASWSLVGGTAPVRFALAALPENTSEVRLIISTHLWALTDPDTGYYLPLDLLWCRRIPGTGQMLVCGAERPGSSC